MIFLGTARKYVVRLADGSEWVVLRQVSDPPFDFGDTGVQLAWPAEKATAFPD